MAFLDFNAAQGPPLQLFASRPTPVLRVWRRPRPAAKPVSARHRANLAFATLASAIAAPSAYAGDYFDDPLLGLLAAVLLYATSAPIAAWLVGGDRAAVRVDHTKI
ncbi:hypothetical protein [Sphingomonas sp. KC8]|uniref:hypothetical protein n=1 Tax=Sphingomonas sp. KC8 TaxID=1030157 RepID=UPI000248BB7A|nr:hypothetical protein [Sphingomonas sp. KC8]ARS25957.1 hypothetical protein KC8_01430 [Sphingomonas sp. KC8]